MKAGVDSVDRSSAADTAGIVEIAGAAEIADTAPRVAELRQFALVHARAQQIPQPVIDAVLGRVEHDAGGPGSWAHEWMAAGGKQEAAGDLLAASRLYTMARFPYPDGPERRLAADRSTSAFGRWCAQTGAGLEPISVGARGGGMVHGWSCGLDEAAAGPVVIVSGGIVTTKEQWAPILLQLRQFGVAGIAVEMPRVGANTVPYDENAWTMYADLIDVLVERTGAQGVHALAMSFSGQLALRCALHDSRLRSVATIGTPIHAAFADPEWQRQLPGITADTLAYLTGGKADDLAPSLRAMALAEEELAALEIPVAYIASTRDEIIPAADIDLLKRHVRRLELVENDDVHGSPEHLDETGPWLMRAVLAAHTADGG
jgi:pimeloyl-ACP methyl ester carboxylesterase